MNGDGHDLVALLEDGVYVASQDGHWAEFPYDRFASFESLLGNFFAGRDDDVLPMTVPHTPRMDATMLLALTGMDGGLVSTGTVKHLMQDRSLLEVWKIELRKLYIDNFPASMEITALFRPHVRYRRGLIKSFDMPGNEFYADPPANIAFFLGKEPNLDWQGSPTASSRWSACWGKAGHLHGQLRRQRAARRGAAAVRVGVGEEAPAAAAEARPGGPSTRARRASRPTC